ncbi:hypothetical protein MSAN_02362100 [Mycena sanguinolenta]|uniref:Uncharacterized protein n=1 Tax=Mycena sanguinolenta TaxID=230812 RepID=A0A8H7CGS3_9AGAR|nr:hypothetical protein MSAN_02362100 [Mycena sanguinolenta]
MTHPNFFFDTHRRCRTELPPRSGSDTVHYKYGWIVSFDEVFEGLAPQNILEPAESPTGCIRGYAAKYAGARPKVFAVRDPKSCAVVLSIATSYSTEKEVLVGDDAYRAACWDCIGLPVEKKDREGKWFRLPVLEVPDGYRCDASPVPTARHLVYF